MIIYVYTYSICGFHSPGAWRSRRGDALLGEPGNPSDWAPEQTTHLVDFRGCTIDTI